MTTVASFLREKVSNMGKWLQEEGLPFELQLPTVSDLQITAFAHTLNNEYADVIERREFATLRADIPMEVLKVIDYVENKPPLHDKFWRYLKLFSEVVCRYE